MEAFQQRVVDEKTELDAKLAKLTPFTESKTFASLPEPERTRLLRQENIMKRYSEVLGERIAAF
jgi:hypothetical protein